MIEICSITVEHHRENLGIGEPCPRISWSFKGDERGWVQSSYKLEVLHGIQEPRRYEMQSSNSVLEPWPGRPLKSREDARVRVKASSKDGRATPWSGWTYLEFGLLDREGWNAQLIAAPRTLAANGSLRPAIFRRKFSFPSEKRVLFARLYITSYGIYEVSINGQKVGNDHLTPGWTSYKHRLNYHTYDITSMLKSAREPFYQGNVIVIEVGEGWHCGRLGFDGGSRFIYGDKLAVLAQLEIRYHDNENCHTISTEAFGTGPGWKVSSGPIISSEIYDGETYDARLGKENWASADYDDELWSSPEVLPFPKAELVAPEGPPVRTTEVVTAKEILKTPSGKCVVDFGQNLVGWLRVKVSGPSGHTITFTHVEVLENGEAATRPLRDCKAKDTLILSGDSITWSPKFTFHGFRYVQVDNWPSGIPNLKDIEAIVIHTDMQETGTFTCSDPMVNKLHENIRWGMRGNFVSIPTDCPQRDERLGWTGDIQIFCPTANFLYNTTGMLSGWLKDLAVEQIKDTNGVVPNVIPNILGPNLTQPQAAWSDAAIMTPWDLYNSSGDTSILSTQYESMKMWLEKGIARQQNGLWDPKCSQLGDWLDPAAPPSEPANGKTDAHFVANAYLVHVTGLMAQITGVLKMNTEAEHYTSEAQRLKKLFQDEYITPNGRLAPDSMTALALAICYDLFATEQHLEYAAERLDALVRSSRFTIATGFVGTPLILPALMKVGKTQLAYRMLLQTRCPSWLYPITMGATSKFPIFFPLPSPLVIITPSGT